MPPTVYLDTSVILHRLRLIEFLPRLPDGARTEGVAELLICGGGLNGTAMEMENRYENI